VTIVLRLLLATAMFSHPAVAADAIEVTLLANEGVLVSGGGRSVLIDGCVREPYAGYAAVPDDAWAKLLAAEPPFERLDVVLVSHAHRDHFQVEPARELLLARPDSKWVVHREVAALLEAGWPQWREVAARVTTVAPSEDEPAIWRGDGVEVELRRLPHGAARTLPENLAHVVHLAGRTIVHVGDAQATAAQIEAAGLASRTFDVALLPSWYWLGDEWATARRALAGRLGTIALHRAPGEAPPAAPTGEKSPLVLDRPLDRRSFRP
jgi:L-ascorbate metabolism protein UlaG (beta-lactamase superfamily)